MLATAGAVENKRDARVRSSGELKGLCCTLCCIVPEEWEAGFNDGNRARYSVRCGADQLRARRLSPATHPLRKKKVNSSLVAEEQRRIQRRASTA